MDEAQDRSSWRTKYKNVVDLDTNGKKTPGPFTFVD
jgi:hypothetical protein